MRIIPHIFLAALAAVIAVSSISCDRSNGKEVTLVTEAQTKVAANGYAGAGGLTWDSGPVHQIRVKLRHLGGPPVDVYIFDKKNGDIFYDQKTGHLGAAVPTWSALNFRSANLDSGWVPVDLPDTCRVVVSNDGDDSATISVNVTGMQEHK